MRDETGAVTLDWVVLTAVIIGTGFSVLQSVSSGVETASVDTASSLRGIVIRESFSEDDLCGHGIEGLRAREAQRVAEGGEDPVDISHWLATLASAFDDEALADEHSRTSGELSGGAWSREHTINGLLACDMARRGLG